jgi:hypothetical protein
VELETLAAASGGKAWTVSEAGTGVIRTVVTAPDADIILPHIAKKYEASMLITQPWPAPVLAGAGRIDELSARIKRQLDPKATYGNLA